MGCLEQHQICSAHPAGSSGNQPGCTPLTGRAVLYTTLSQDNGSSIGLNEWQWATAYRLLQTVDETGLSKVILKLSASSLEAQKYLDWQSPLDFTSSPLPNFLWMREVSNWHNITLANLQRWMIDYVSGPADPEFDKYIRAPSTAQELAMCSNQRTRCSDAMSFNGLGLIIIISVGSLIIITNLSLSLIVGFVQNWFKKGVYRRTEWALDETLQLQRMAYERADQGTWRKTESMVPLSERDEKFRHLRYFDGAIYSPSTRDPVMTEYHYVALKS